MTEIVVGPVGWAVDVDVTPTVLLTVVVDSDTVDVLPTDEVEPVPVEVEPTPVEVAAWHVEVTMMTVWLRSGLVLVVAIVVVTP